MKQRFEIPYKPDSMNTHWRRGNNVTYLSKKLGCDRDYFIIEVEEISEQGVK